MSRSRRSRSPSSPPGTPGRPQRCRSCKVGGRRRARLQGMRHWLATFRRNAKGKARHLRPAQLHRREPQELVQHAADAAQCARRGVAGDRRDPNFPAELAALGVAAGEPDEVHVQARRHVNRRRNGLRGAQGHPGSPTTSAPAWRERARFDAVLREPRRLDAQGVQAVQEVRRSSTVRPGDWGAEVQEFPMAERDGEAAPGASPPLSRSGAPMRTQRWTLAVVSAATAMLMLDDRRRQHGAVGHRRRPRHRALGPGVGRRAYTRPRGDRPDRRRARRPARRVRVFADRPRPVHGQLARSCARG